MIRGLVVDRLGHDLRLLLDVLVVAVVLHLLSRLHEEVVLVGVLHRRQEALQHAQDLSHDVGLENILFRNIHNLLK